jgi:sulfate adenylyltransferase
MNEPHGGRLVYNVLSERERESVLEQKDEFQQIALRDEVVKDVKNIGFGTYSPLTGFLNEDEFESVVDCMRLPNGLAWSIPIVLDVDTTVDDEILLTNNDGKIIATMTVEDRYGYDRHHVVENVFKTGDRDHPGVADIYRMNETLIGGEIQLIDTEKEPFYNVHLDPKETRVLFKELGWRTIVAFQTRNPPHRGHEYLQKAALEIVDGLFINPVIGKKKPGDFRDEAILRSYEILLNQYFPPERAVMSILPTKMRYAGPREAIFHAVVRKNFGCTHFIVGRDHAGVGTYYGTYDAQNIFDMFESSELRITPLKFEHVGYCKTCGCYASLKTCPHEKIPPSGTKIRQMIQAKELPPPELMREEVARYLLSIENPFVIE